MSKSEKQPINLMKMYIEGWKILIGYYAFTIFISVSYLLLMIIIEKIGAIFGTTLGIITLFIIFPFLFTLISRYLNIFQTEVSINIECPHCHKKTNETAKA